MLETAKEKEPSYQTQWKVIKTEGGELQNRKENMPKKKKRGFLERAIEAITGAFLAYLSGSATLDIVRFVLLFAGIILILYAIASD